MIGETRGSVAGAADAAVPGPAPAGDPAARRLPGEVGAWLFILLDMVVFGVFFATYMYYRNAHPAVFAAGQGELSRPLGVAMTIALLAGSLFVVFAVQAARASDGRVASRSFAVAIGCGLAFVGLKAVEYAHLFHEGYSTVTDDFFFCYFILTGVHLVHVGLGLGVLVLLRRIARRGAADPESAGYLESGACFWHMVDLLWIVLFPLVYFVA